MKRVFTLVFLSLIVVTTLVTGTLAIYTIDAPDLESGDVTAKNFAFVAEGKEGFTENIKIAPNESTQKGFSVSNFDADRHTETAMAVTISVKITGDIAPLQLKVTTPEAETAEITQVSSTEVIIKFKLSPGRDVTRTFYVDITWPDTANDNDYMGKTSKIVVEATAVQA